MISPLVKKLTCLGVEHLVAVIEELIATLVGGAEYKLKTLFVNVGYTAFGIGSTRSITLNIRLPHPTGIRAVNTYEDLVALNLINGILTSGDMRCHFCVAALRREVRC